MFTDKQKLNKDSFDELTKLGNLLDTINIGYFVIGKFAMYAYNLSPATHAPVEIVVTPEKNKKKLLNTLFKLNYVIKDISKKEINVFKNTKNGELAIKLYLVEEKENNNSELFIKEKKLRFNNKETVGERAEIQILKIGKGYYRVAPIEFILLTKMGGANEEELLDLEALNSSDKIDMDKLIKLFEINELV